LRLAKLPPEDCYPGGIAEVKPQDYSARIEYRPPAGWYRRLNWLGVLITSVGLAPRDAVTLRVRGRTSGKNRAHFYFGVGPDPSIDDIRAIVDHYPVFRVISTS
jgi:hypothetical protein